MAAQNKWVRTIRLIVLAYFLIAALVTAFLLSLDNSLKAPLLTLIGTASLIVVLFPVLPTVTNVGAVMGTAIVMGGSGAWFIDATEGQVSPGYLLFQITIAATVAFVAVSLILSNRRGESTKSSCEKPKPTDRKNALMVFVALSLLIFVWRVVQSKFEPRQRDDVAA